MLARHVRSLAPWFLAVGFPSPALRRAIGGLRQPPCCCLFSQLHPIQTFLTAQPPALQGRPSYTYRRRRAQCRSRRRRVVLCRGLSDKDRVCPPTECCCRHSAAMTREERPGLWAGPPPKSLGSAAVKTLLHSIPAKRRTRQPTLLSIRTVRTKTYAMLPMRIRQSRLSCEIWIILRPAVSRPLQKLLYLLRPPDSSSTNFPTLPELPH